MLQASNSNVALHGVNMKEKAVEELATLLQSSRERVLTEWRRKVRQSPITKGSQSPVINDHIATLLDDLAAALVLRPKQGSEHVVMQVGTRIQTIRKFEADFTEMVAEYSLLREAIKELAGDSGLQ